MGSSSMHELPVDQLHFVQMDWMQRHFSFLYVHGAKTKYDSYITWADYDWILQNQSITYDKRSTVLKTITTGQGLWVYQRFKLLL